MADELTVDDSLQNLGQVWKIRDWSVTGLEFEFQQNGDVDLFDEPGRCWFVKRSDLVPLDVDLHDALAAVGHQRQEVVERYRPDSRFVTEEASGQSGARVVGEEIRVGRVLHVSAESDREWMDGRTDGWTNRRKDGSTE